MPGLSAARLQHPGVAFLDRDGTINVKAPEGDYITRAEEVELLPGAARAIRQLSDAGVTVIVVTNQRGIALGRMTEADLAAIHQELTAQLDAAAGAHIDAFFFCPHDRGECDCRKPGTALFHQARDRYPWIDFAASAMVGDSLSDVEAGEALGMATFQLGVNSPDLLEAVERLLAPEADLNRSQRTGTARRP